jgi:hypothetical protein
MEWLLPEKSKLHSSLYSKFLTWLFRKAYPKHQKLMNVIWRELCVHCLPFPYNKNITLPAPVTLDSKNLFVASSQQQLELSHYEAAKAEAEKLLQEAVSSQFLKLEHKWPYDFRKILYQNPGQLKEDVFVNFVMEEKLLAIAKDYLGITPCLKDITLACDVVSDSWEHTRLWHCDQFEHKIVRLIIYLNDVDEKGGVLEVVNAPASAAGRYRWKAEQELRQGQDYNSYFQEKYFQEEDIRRFVGQAGTFIFTDTASCLHRGLAPESGNRLMLMATYGAPIPHRLVDPLATMPRGWSNLVKSSDE